MLTQAAAACNGLIMVNKSTVVGDELETALFKAVEARFLVSCQGVHSPGLPCHALCLTCSARGQLTLHQSHFLDPLRCLSAGLSDMGVES